MKSFKEFILDEECWKGYTQKGMKKKGKKMVPNCVKESFTPGDNGTQPFVPDTSAKFKIEHQGKNWFHGGRVSVNPFSGQRLYQYVQEADPLNPKDVSNMNTVWADINGQVVGDKYPEASHTPARDSIEAGEGSGSSAE